MQRAQDIDMGFRSRWLGGIWWNGECIFPPAWYVLSGYCVDTFKHGAWLFKVMGKSNEVEL